MRKLSLILFLTVTFINSYAQSKAFLDSALLGKAPSQGGLSTCLKWSLLYGMLSYHHNTKSKSTKPTYFSPCYNLNTKCEDLLNICDLLKSINNDGLLYSPPLFSCECSGKSISSNIERFYNSNLITLQQFNRENPLSDSNLVALKKEISQKKYGFVLCYTVKNDPNQDIIMEGGYHAQKFLKSSLLDQKKPYKHAIFCIGYDDSKLMPNQMKGGFLFRDSDWRTRHNGEVWISYDELKKGFVDEIFLYNKQLEGEKFDKKSPLCSKYKHGSSADKTWWLGKPAISLKKGFKIRYYFTEHHNFRITVLKLPYILGNKATIGILNRQNERLYSFALYPKQSAIFSVNDTVYQFFYDKKSFKRGNNKIYPEINYRLETYDCSKSIPYN